VRNEEERKEGSWRRKENPKLFGIELMIKRGKLFSKGNQINVCDKAIHFHLAARLVELIPKYY